MEHVLNGLFILCAERGAGGRKLQLEDGLIGERRWWRRWRWRRYDNVPFERPA